MGSPSSCRCIEGVGASAGGLLVIRSGIGGPGGVESFGMKVDVHAAISDLSVGEQQVVEILRVLSRGADVIILDEPTSGLDPNQLLEIRRLIRDISVNKTVIFSTHIMQEVQALCQRVVIINRGKLVANSDVASLQAGSRNEKVTLVEFEAPVELEALQSIPGVLRAEDLGRHAGLVEAGSGDLVTVDDHHHGVGGWDGATRVR